MAFVFPGFSLGFTDEALAGLSSTENLASASQALRRTQKDKSGISTEVNKLGGFQDVMLIQIKGELLDLLSD